MNPPPTIGDVTEVNPRRSLEFPEPGGWQESSAETRGFRAMDLKVHSRGLIVTAIALAIWIFLALRNPALTYHFAPLIAAGAWPVAIRRKQAATVSDALTAGVTAAIVVGVVSVVLHVTNNMDGPTFLDTRPALAEALLFAAVGAAVGIRSASRENPGLLGRIFS